MRRLVFLRVCFGVILASLLFVPLASAPAQSDASLSGLDDYVAATKSLCDDSTLSRLGESDFWTPMGPIGPQKSGRVARSRCFLQFVS
jgi:hypothetical protein